MIPEIKKILYTTDLSESARYAFGYAVSLANRYGADLTILHVMEDLSGTQGMLVINAIGEKKWSEIRDSNKKEVLDALKERVEQFCAEVSGEHPECPFLINEIVVTTGNPVEEILKQAEKKESDLLVMGAHGHGILAGAMIGSISRRVLRQCKKPVLVIRLPAGKKD
jgi:nucleotide-binding universal stress UspA family protein